MLVAWRKIGLTRDWKEKLQGNFNPTKIRFIFIYLIF
jgi:hypothetical protein